MPSVVESASADTEMNPCSGGRRSQPLPPLNRGEFRLALPRAKESCYPCAEGLGCMLLRSATFRYLLALLMAIWSPVCLCQADAPAQSPEHAHSERNTHHGHEDSDGPADHHEGCPGHDHKGSSCDCPQLAATTAKADQAFKISFPQVIAILSWHESDWSVFSSNSLGCTRPIRAAPRPPTSLLGMHCALIV